jgi:hypothetical protein
MSARNVSIPASSMWTHDRVGGMYMVLGESIGAGISNPETRIIYQCQLSGKLFHRTRHDFVARMKSYAALSWEEPVGKLSCGYVTEAQLAEYAFATKAPQINVNLVGLPRPCDADASTAEGRRIRLEAVASLDEEVNAIRARQTKLLEPILQEAFKMSVEELAGVMAAIEPCLKRSETVAAKATVIPPRPKPYTLHEVLALMGGCNHA